MAHNFSKLNSEFKVSNIHRVEAIDTRQLVRKDIVDIRVSETTDKSDVGIAYVYIPIKDIEDNLSIINKGALMPENALAESISTLNLTFTGPNYDDVISPYFLVSDEFTVATSTDPSAPLYYAHIIPTTLNGNIVVDCDVLDSNYNPVSQRLFIKDIDGNSLYTNLNNSYDESSGELSVYYVKYIYEDSTSSNLLLNVHPIYEPADFEDLDDFGSLKSGVKKYILDYDSGGGGYSLTMPLTDQYAITYEARASISIVPPKADILDRIWFLRIKNGDFIKAYGDLFRYDIPEFSDQLFNPYEPYKFAIMQDCDVLTDGLIKLPDENIRIYVGESLHVDLVIKDSEDNIIHATSTISSKDGAPFIDEEGTHDITWDNDLIHSYDEAGGFIKLNAQLRFSDKVQATYYYKEDHYELTLLNINPISNIDAGVFRYAFYLVPGGLSNPSRQKSIYYLMVDDLGVIQYCSQKGGDGNVDLATGIEGTLSYDKDVDNFVDRYTTIGEDSEDTHYLLVGEVTLTDPYKNDELSVIDTRLEGGGIREDYDIDEGIDSHPEIKWYEDIGYWDGQPHSGNSVLLVKLPYTILADYGGTFEKNEVQSIVERHVAFGTHAVIRYYGNVADVLSFIPGDTVIDMTWSDLGTGYTYDVYTSTNHDGVYTKHNGAPIATTSYSVDSLVNNKIYYVYIIASKDGISYPKSEIWSAMPFAPFV